MPFAAPPLRRALAAALLLALLGAGVSAGGATAGERPRPGKRALKPARTPVVIGHRGASGYRPEHTLASYALAARMGADYIEPDLVSTKDHVLVARHENEISTTTDVADRPEFASRRTTKVVDGITMTGWFTEDFTLAELRTLRAKERIPAIRQRNTLYDGRYAVPTFSEVVALARRLSRRLHRRIGIYPETKHPSYFRSIGLPLEPPLVATLRRAGLNRRNAPVFVQSFEVANLKALRGRLRVPLVQLLGAAAAQPYDVVAAGGTTTYGDLATPAGLRSIAAYADAVGPSKEYVVPVAPDGTSLPATSFVRDAHAARLAVHPYTFRNENVFLPAQLRRGADPAAYGDAFGEYALFFAAGVDGVFSDNPDTAVAARESR
jgi:glycerophosphoryl diester phosphodiesterase